ncbi:GNAT family N-acetyltransferase [Anaeromicrobium sediminis]|uniref:GNAT family N-acetyltransferase n=1 Tax=Anaeromicrobium sediminis TaxID=1478221 RepID=A0A267MLB2_9FIRM|nr:GNAT family N-acetyltransferase [Anaeromicrobium sediminis]PAB60326.1 GNAT family N-acetyltransferase [Anaeromicrobium sediminis]
MLTDGKIIECEVEYSKCFSEFCENENIIRYRDNQLNDMYYHNYTYIKKPISEIELKHIIQDEISLRLSEKNNFCNVILNGIVNCSELSTLKYKPEISTNGYYLFDVSYFSRLNVIDGCIIKKVDHQEMVDDILFCDLQHDEKRLGKDFCKKRCYRRGKVYVSNKGVNSYVCYHNGDIIGNCDLFINNGVAKIEDFAVIPTYQRKGYGTTILKSIIDIAIKENSHTIYLVTDEDDTAKEMYEKIGFNKIGERTDLFFQL